jgi:hypothetical protein
MGQLSLILATHIDSTTTATVRSLASLCKAHRETLVAALKDVPVVSADDPLARIRAQRRARMNQP